MLLFWNKVKKVEDLSGLSANQLTFKRLIANRGTLVAFGVLATLILLAFILPLLIPHNHEDVFWDKIKAPPEISSWHWFGFDDNGRDLLSRTLLGMRVSLQVAILATIVSVVVGVIYGAVSGYVGGRVDEAMMRFVDIMYALPYILFVILLMVIFGRNETLLYLGIGLLEWITMARIVRGQTLSLKEKEFVEAARALGLPTRTIILRHIVPNLVGPVAIYATLTIPEIILTESFLSYLGFGIQEPRTSLGTLISDGSDKLGVYPWMLIFPGIILVTMLYCLIFLGDGLKDAFDPRSRKR